MEQLSVEADLLKYRVTKGDLERIAVAAAGHPPKGFRTVEYRSGSEERLHCEQRIRDEGETRCRKCARPKPPLRFQAVEIIVRQRDTEGVKDSHRSRIAHARRPNGFRGVPP